MRDSLRLLGLAAALVLSHCSAPPRAPGDSVYRGGQATAYRLGYHHGFMDGSRKLDDNFERYHDEYRPEGRDVFARGYQLGHDAGRHSAAADATEEDRAFQDGYDAGQADAENGARPDHRRYRSQFSAGSEPAFREGYNKGYHDVRDPPR